MSSATLLQRPSPRPGEEADADEGRPGGTEGGEADMAEDYRSQGHWRPANPDAQILPGGRTGRDPRAMDCGKRGLDCRPAQRAESGGAGGPQQQ
jgi:hypothetical protein